MRIPQRRANTFGWALVAIVAMMACGCSGRATDRRAIDGTVTLDGKPVDGGNIQFEPLDAKKTSASGALIQKGRYSIPRQTGLAPGKYRVCIFWSEKIDPKRIPHPVPGVLLSPKDVPHAKELIPAKYNTESALTIEVGQGASATFDFLISTNQLPLSAPPDRR